MKPVKCSFIKPPSADLIKSWKAFLALGTRLESWRRYSAGVELFSEDETIKLFASVGIRVAEDRPKVCAPNEKALKTPRDIRKEAVELLSGSIREPLPSVETQIAEALKNDAKFPFLTGIPLSARAALAIISGTYATSSKVQGIEHVEALFRLLCLPLEQYEAEGIAFLRYVSSKNSYIGVYQGENQESLFFLNTKGFKALLGIDIAQVVIDEDRMSPYLVLPRRRRKKSASDPSSQDPDCIVPQTTLDDVVLEEEIMLKLKTVVAYAHTVKSKPFKVLFHGAPGTGKSYTAKALAGSLKTNLLTVPSTKIYSMFVGESEKNICRVFDRAEKEHAIIFFDEADSLIRERTHTIRWEIASVNTMLQNIESSIVPVILCTNAVLDNLDDALLRRMDEILEFKIPDHEARARIWEKELRKHDISVADIAIDQLSKIVLSGGLIANVASNAARQKAVHKDLMLDTETLMGLAIDEQKKKMGKSRDDVSRKVVGFGA